MLVKAWDEVERLYSSPQISRRTVELFKDLKQSQSSHTKNEGNPKHLCSFFVPYDDVRKLIYLGHHKKANDWIPPGGHLEPGETPSLAAIREMKEELETEITPNDLEPWSLSVKYIGRPDSGCTYHYDIWHLVHLPKRDFNYLKSEYYTAGWFSVNAAPSQIKHNPDFAEILRLI